MDSQIEHTVDWSKTLIHCSAIGKIMTTERKYKPISQSQLDIIAKYEARTKAMTPKMQEEYDYLVNKRDNPVEAPLSKTAQSYLRELYAWIKYGKRTASKDAKNKFTEKGKRVEEESITLLSRFCKKWYEKNEDRKRNEYISGECDIHDEEESEITDVKSSWDLDSMLSKVGKPIDFFYWHQIQGYLELWDAKKGRLCYCLVNTPPELINDEKWKLFKKLNPVTEEDPEYISACDQKERDMTFDDMPVEHRIKMILVEKDPEIMKKVYRRVEMSRQWLVEFEKEHTSPQEIVASSLNLDETENEEDNS